MPTLRQRLAHIAPYFAPSRKGYIVGVVASAVVAATEPAIPALMQPLLDRGFTEAGIPLWMVPLAILGLFFVRGGAQFVSQYAMSWSNTRAVLALRRAMFAQVLRAAPGLFTRRSASSLTNTMVHEANQGANQLVNAGLTVVRDSLTLVALVGYLMWLNWKLTLFVMLLGPAIGGVIHLFSGRLRRLSRAALSANDELAYVIEENALAWRVVRLHGAAEQQERRFAKLSDQLRRLQMKSVVSAATLSPLTQFIAACALSAVIAVALYQGSRGGVTVGSFVAFVTAMLLMIPPIKRLSDVTAPLTRGLAALERAVAVVEDHPRETGGSHAPAAGRVRGEVELRGVTVRYGDDSAPALDGIDIVLHAGETVALVGPSGAGKSTLIHLLPRFVEPTAGEVRLDGVPLAQWDIAALRRQFALVSQDVVLFNDSVAANVALGGDLDRGRVRAALASAHLLDFVDALPQGLDGAIGHNGAQLSGGQRQRLAIARAIYKDAPVLILDEATSALDSESERAVQDALETLMRGRTTIVIAHRLSTIEHADRIVALEAGRIVEQGRPADLLAAGGLYARLHGLQFRS
jgi:subfamily B ATP-binding cassette protein MsbA